MAKRERPAWRPAEVSFRTLTIQVLNLAEWMQADESAHCVNLKRQWDLEMDPKECQTVNAELK